ncbi:SdrD B-like domain-containing protein [Opitutus sp. ER46]|uniref:SdrD B-like domain-containing protein n=1 Tax=Opitutus sp. ER46 TaxID=2161864 RepID=UPI000D31AA2E|nr:SdrD B-like domain-containing protein [Opitutus sp. ER46]PTX95525.1 hypothetical protein DB354_08870 [Opitutus sp. ER46]
MNTIALLAGRLPRWMLVVCAFASLAAASLRATDDAGLVIYRNGDLASYGVAGVPPVTGTFTLSITAPKGPDYTGGKTVTLTNTVLTSPVVENEVALGYVTFGAPTLTFTAAGETKSVEVTVTIPKEALDNEITSGTYSYAVSTTGWGSGVLPGSFRIDAAVDATLPEDGFKPVVSISTPADGSSYTLASGSMTIPFAFSVIVNEGRPMVEAVSASFGPQDGDAASMLPVALTSEGVGTAAVTASGNITVTKAGTYTLLVTGTNSIGTAYASAHYTFTVGETTPPTVTISSPAENSNYTYRTGQAPVEVPLAFVGSSAITTITNLTVTDNGVALTYLPTGLGTATAAGNVTLRYSTAGTHEIVVTATDANGKTATATTHFTVNVVAPTPTVAISTPLNGATLTLPTGFTTLDVDYAFAAASNNGFVVDAVTAVLGTTTLSPTLVNPGTAAVTGSGTLTNLPSGSYTLTVTAKSAGITVTDTVSFTIVPATTLPPKVVINSPADGAVFYRMPCGPAASVPLSFTGTSRTTGAVITGLTATLDGSPVTIQKANLGTASATGTATLSVCSTGTHTVVVTATDIYGTATATHTFKVDVTWPRTLVGEVFFDVDRDGRDDCADFGLSCVTVTLLNASNQVVDTTKTGCNGVYAFVDLVPGLYTVVATAPEGMSLTTCSPLKVRVDCWLEVAPDIGFGLDFAKIKGMTADGNTIGFWKNNLQKADACRTNGTQVSRTDLLRYTCRIEDFAFWPFDCLSLSTATSILSKSSSRPADLLAKQLLASEYNYQNGAYLNGNAQLTFAFLYWGEYVLTNANCYSSTYVLWAKDWFDAYNNSHGGAVNGPSS